MLGEFEDWNFLPSAIVCAEISQAEETERLHALKQLSCCLDQPASLQKPTIKIINKKSKLLFDPLVQTCLDVSISLIENILVFKKWSSF